MILDVARRSSARTAVDVVVVPDILANDGVVVSGGTPLRGSRFAADGARLEGPASCGLMRLDNR